MTYPVDTSLKPEVTGFFDPETNTISYVVKDPGSAACAVVDSVMDIDYAAGLGRPDVRISVFDSSGLLILTADNSVFDFPRIAFNSGRSSPAVSMSRS